MSEKPPNDSVCIHCGTSRPVDEELCPNCGKPWIDEKVDDLEPVPAPPGGDDTGAQEAGAAAAAVAATTDGLDDTGEFSFDDWTMPPEKPRSRAKWLIPIILLAAVAVVWGLVFLDSDGSPGTTIAAPTTTEASATTDAPADDTPTTTAPETTTTTTTIDYPPPSAWEAVGDPIDTADLTLKATAIGPLDFGTSIEEVAGRLTASLGTADESGVDGLCPPQETYSLQWGELLAIFDGFEPDALFVSYRYEDLGSDTEMGLATLSGLELGDTVGDLKQIYAQFTITFEVIDGKDHFRLLDGGELLLWGPISSTADDGIVEGIYSPSPCEDQ
jgi:hypothetical protein